MNSLSVLTGVSTKRLLTKTYGLKILQIYSYSQILVYHLQRQQSDIIERHSHQTQWIEAEEGLVNHSTDSLQPDSEKRETL